MEIQHLQEWIQHPDLLNVESLYELRKLLERYPCFQVARLLYLKNLYLLHDSSFQDELRGSALFIPDLSVLFYYIEGDRFVISPKGDENGQISGSGTTDRTLDLIDRFLAGMPLQQSEESVLPPIETSMDYTSVLKDEPADESVPSVPLNGQELIDSFIEKSEETPEALFPKQEEKEGEDTVNPDENMDKETEEESDEESYFTETLAKIYVKQQRYDKALEIIKKLNLKYPQKNAYFADQIRFLEKLIINVNSK